MSAYPPDRDGERLCGCCSQWKPSSEFHRYRDKRRGSWSLQRKCRDCRSRLALEWNLANPERYAANQERYRARRQTYRARRRKRAQMYGLHEMQLAAMEAAQQGLCLICRKFCPGDADWRNGLVIDHDHARGHVRGLLCMNCNAGLGAFNDDPYLLLRAIRYLRKSENALFAAPD